MASSAAASRGNGAVREGEQQPQTRPRLCVPRHDGVKKEREHVAVVAQWQQSGIHEVVCRQRCRQRPDNARCLPPMSVVWRLPATSHTDNHAPGAWGYTLRDEVAGRLPALLPFVRAMRTEQTNVLLAGRRPTAGVHIMSATYPSVLYIDDTDMPARLNVTTPAGLLLQQECRSEAGGPN